MSDEEFADEFSEVNYFGKQIVFPRGKHKICEPSPRYLDVQRKMLREIGKI